jgi:hypothetical protein
MTGRQESVPLCRPTGLQISAKTRTAIATSAIATRDFVNGFIADVRLSGPA